MRGDSTKTLKETYCLKKHQKTLLVGQGDAHKPHTHFVCCLL